MKSSRILSAVDTTYLCAFGGWFATSFVVLLSQACTLPSTPPNVDWREYGGSPDQSKYVDTRTLRKDNINTLKVKWTYPTTDRIAYQFNPIVVDTIMYVLARNNSLVALHAATGEEVWIHENLEGITKRGINYWESRDGKEKRLLLTIRNTLQALDAKSGLPILTFGNRGIISLNEGLGVNSANVGQSQPTIPGRIFEDLFIIGSSPGEGLFAAPGHIRAYNVVTGKLIWVFHTIPQPGEYGYDTWPKDAYKYVGGVNVWGEISLDERRGIAYFPIGSPTYDYHGADRKGENLFANCLLALDVRTGKRLWHYQTVHHDIWDYDLATAPQLITVTHQGMQIDAVAQASKQGFLFVFDRVTGKPLWPIIERCVPPSTVPGEEAWPTQPFPTVLPPFNRQAVTPADISPIRLSDAEFQQIKERVRKAQTGLYTPLSTENEVVAMPGAVGGANWGNSASDPDNGIVYILTQEYPSFYRLEGVINTTTNTVTKEGGRLQLLGKGRVTYNQYCQSCHGKNGIGQIGPSLARIGDKLDFNKFRTVVQSGRGQMPAFQHIDHNALTSIYRYLNELKESESHLKAAPNEGRKQQRGNVIASNGAFDYHPGVAFVNTALRASYPSGIIDTPTQRFVAGYGLEFPHVVTPPWSYLIAYDLNKGKIKWKTPLGIDSITLKKGYTNTGVPHGAQRKGMIVTSSGLIFATAADQHIYAFDASDGKILWKHKLPLTSEALPSYYRIDGTEYIVVSASKIDPSNVIQQGEYVVFAVGGNKNKISNRDE